MKEIMAEDNECLYCNTKVKQDVGGFLCRSEPKFICHNCGEINYSYDWTSMPLTSPRKHTIPDKNIVEQAESAYMTYLTHLHKMIYGTNGCKWSNEGFVLKHGYIFDPRNKAKNNYCEPKLCYNNSILKAQQHNLIYCEGYCSTGIICFEHAWCCDEEGTIYDFTLSDGLFYIGIPFKNKKIIDNSLKHGYYLNSISSICREVDCDFNADISKYKYENQLLYRYLKTTTTKEIVNE